MPNHVHLIAVPSDKDGLCETFADAHRRYTGYINARLRTTGHLWQGRFGLVVMDESHLFYAVRYISPILDRYGDFAALLGNSTDNEPEFKRLRQSETTGRPLGSEEWMERLEKMTGKTLKPQKRGPKMQDHAANSGF